MKRNSIFASLLALVALLGVFATMSGSAQAASSPVAFTIATAFNPDPPTKGVERMTITVKDVSGAPVKGAAVSIASSMSSMSMAGPRVTATDNHDGTYSATLPLKYATTWTFTITVSRNGKVARAEVSRDVR